MHDDIRVTIRSRPHGCVEDIERRFDRHRFYDLAEMKRRLAAHLHWFGVAASSHEVCSAT